MDEAAARQALLAQAIETTDAEGRLLTAAERDSVDLLARQDALQRTGGRGAMAPEAFIELRSQRLLGAVGARHPGVVALQESGGWRPWLEWGLPAAALVTGALTDMVGNPHRLDLVSLPLLGIVAWNVAMYLLLVAASLVSRGRSVPWAARVGRLGGGGALWRLRGDDPQAQVAARFQALWLRATEALHLQRVKRVLHVSAAAWALGVILSLLVRGLVVEYRVGWESTFLGPTQVHAILSVLRLPALLVLPFEPFSVMDVAQLRFSNGGGAAGGAPWVWMYVSLLITVVVLPRLLLATFAAWRENRLERSIDVGLADPYHERILSLLNATQVRLGLVTHRQQDRDSLYQLLVAQGHAPPVAAASEIGDVLLVEDFPRASAPIEPPATWWQRALRALPGTGRAPVPAEEAVDVLVHVVGAPDDDPAAAKALAPGVPVLLVRMPGAQGVPVEGALDFRGFAACWISHPLFFDAAGGLLPASKLNGYRRIVAAIQARHAQRLRDSTSAIARHLLDAARQSAEVPASALTVRNLLPGERQAQSDARQAAMDAMVARVRASSAEMFTRLRQLHGVDEAGGEALEQVLEERFLVQQSIDAPQAGMAGAATGAAMGASVDLAVGGLTLGAAAALGALVGGGAAYIAAAWKNRAAPGGGTLVQLSDQMLDALAEGALVRYLAIVHCGDAGTEAPILRGASEVDTAIRARAELLAGYWNAARTQPDTTRLVEPLAMELERAAVAVLKHLYCES